MRGTADRVIVDGMTHDSRPSGSASIRSSARGALCGAALGLVAVAGGGVTAASAATGPPPEACDAPSVDGVTLAPSTPPTEDAPGSTVAYPISVVYAGLCWSIIDVFEGDGDWQGWVLADLRVTSGIAYGVSWDVRVINLETADGVALEPWGMVDNPSWDIAVGSGETNAATLAFDVEAVTGVTSRSLVAEAATLTLIVGAEDHIPAVAPFSGDVDATPAPIDAEFTGSTPALPLEANNAATATTTAIGAQTAIDALGFRAELGSRLAVLDVRLDGPPTNPATMRFYSENFRLTADGVSIEPRALFQPEQPSPSDQGRVEPAETVFVTLVFDIPADAADLALVVWSADGELSAELPVDGAA